MSEDMDWTIVRPLRLLQGGVARGYRIEVGARPAAVGRCSAAISPPICFMKLKHVREIVGITGA
jgi:hypothetical protein